MAAAFIHSVLLLKRFLLALIFYSLCRLVFLLYNLPAFENYSAAEILSTFFYGLLFDVSALSYINLLFVLLHIIPLKTREKKVYQWFLKTIFIATNSIGIVLNLIDAEYFRVSGRRTGSEILKSAADIAPLAMKYLSDYWFSLLILILLVWLLHYFYPKFPYSKYKNNKFTAKQFGLQLIQLVIICGILVVGMRGGFYLKPIRSFDAARFVKNGLVPLTINTPFQVFTTIENKATETPEYFTEKEALEIYNPVQNLVSGQTFRKENVVILILESFGKEYVGYFNKENKGYTPFLDSLLNNGLVFTDAYANGKSSITSIPSILSAVPSLQEMPYINSYYQSNRISSLGSILKEKHGYYSAFYHAARNGSMGFDNFIGISNFGEYYGLDEYPDKEKDFDGFWGIYDEPYLQYFANELNKKPKPFCAALFTISSHHPYPIPAAIKDKFHKGTLPIHQSIQYTDYALKQFFNKISGFSWFNNTVFVITADHSSENETPFYQSFAGKYAVPLLFYKGDGSLKGKIEKTVQHTDILPSVLDYLHYNGKITAFGKSGFDTINAGMAVHYDGGFYQLIQQPYVLHFNGKESTALYNYPSDPLLQNNIKDQQPEIRKKMEKQLKGFIQVFYHFLNNNMLN